MEGQVQDAPFFLFVRIAEFLEIEFEFFSGIAGEVGESDAVEFGNEADHWGNADSVFQVAFPKAFQAGYVFLIGFGHSHPEKPIPGNAKTPFFAILTPQNAPVFLPFLGPHWP